MKPEAATPCACKGTGVLIKAGEYPNLEDRRWCPNCEAGQAKAERVAGIVARSMSKRTIRAA